MAGCYADNVVRLGRVKWVQSIVDYRHPPSGVAGACRTKLVIALGPFTGALVKFSCWARYTSPLLESKSGIISAPPAPAPEAQDSSIPHLSAKHPGNLFRPSSSHFGVTIGTASGVTRCFGPLCKWLKIR
jgi:hypothetical protein